MGQLTSSLIPKVFGVFFMDFIFPKGLRFSWDFSKLSGDDKGLSFSKLSDGRIYPAIGKGSRAQGIFFQGHRSCVRFKNCVRSLRGKIRPYWGCQAARLGHKRFLNPRIYFSATCGGEFPPRYASKRDISLKQRVSSL